MITDWLWFLTAPFREKMFFVTMMVGMSLFMYYILDMLSHWNTKLKALKIGERIRTELALEKQRREKFYNEIRNRNRDGFA